MKIVFPSSIIRRYLGAKTTLDFKAWCIKVYRWYNDCPG